MASGLLPRAPARETNEPGLLSLYGSLAAVLADRQTIREIGAQRLGRQLLSSLLNAACGVNRPHGHFVALGAGGRSHRVRANSR